jgi:23S rRNA pseudouridine1911/1915/1917 synthase
LSEILKPRILRLEIEEADAGKTIKEYLMRKIGFSSKQLSRFKYRRDGILLNGEKRYVNAPLQTGDVLEIRLTQGGEPVEADPCRPGPREGGYQEGGYAAARDGRLQKIWVKPVDWLNSRFPLQILYEDQDILAADKPSGIVCHPSPGHFDDTLSTQVAEHLP